jgi:hypothetical protein
VAGDYEGLVDEAGFTTARATVTVRQTDRQTDRQRGAYGVSRPQKGGLRLKQSYANYSVFQGVRYQYDLRNTGIMVQLPYRGL